MAENYGYGYGRYRDEYDDEYDDAAEDDAAGYDDAAEDDAEYLDAADYDDYGYEDDTVVLTGAVDEPVNYVLDDPAVGESTAYERIRRMKGLSAVAGLGSSYRRLDPAEPHAVWLAGFWAGGGSRTHRGRHRLCPSTSPKSRGMFFARFYMTPLLNGPELARALERDEAVVLEAAQALQQEGLLRSVSFGCLLRPTARYWVAPVHVDTTPGAIWSRLFCPGIVMPALDLCSDILFPGSRASTRSPSGTWSTGWALEGVAWAERDAVQAIGFYNWKQSPQVKSLVYFVWVSQWDTEREIWERLTDLPEAVSRITPPGLSGSVALIGADRWAVAKALPMAVESLSASQVEPADLAAWTYAQGWQAASGASLLDGAVQDFRPNPGPGPAWTGSSGPGPSAALGKTKLSSIINACPWTRPDSRTLYRTLKLVGEHPGASIAHYGALAGESDSELISRKRLGTLLDLGLAREAGIAGVVNLGTPDRPEVLSARGRGQMRYRVSLGAERGGGASKEKARRVERRPYPPDGGTAPFASC